MYDEGHHSAAPLVELVGVSVHFGETRVFQDASLAVAPSEMIAIVGRNGSGKSTLLRCVVGLQEHEGSLRFRSEGEASPASRRWASRLARWTLGAPLALICVALTALFVSSVAYNLFDWMRNEGHCDPENPIVVNCEYGFKRDAAAWIGDGLTHDLTKAAYGPFYYEEVDWQGLVQLAWLLGLLCALATLILLASWWFRQSPALRADARRAAMARTLDLVLFTFALTGLFSLISGFSFWPLGIAAAFLPLAWTEASRPARLSIAYIPQRLGLVERSTVTENVLHGLLVGRSGLGRLRGLLGIWTRDEEARARDVLGVVGIAEFAERRVESLSGGERRRVAMARALVQRAELLLADEFLSEVDEATVERLHGHLRSLCDEHGTAVIFVEHDLSLAVRASDRAFEMTPEGLQPFTGGPLE